MLNALGFASIPFEHINSNYIRYDILFNTVPQQSVDTGILNQLKDCTKVDLASAPGMICDDVIVARGLPGKYAPKSSGKLIADTIHTALKEANP